jgi:outer membrane protein assembly factor BamE (lipoprotein component of BamABCDE complex)
MKRILIATVMGSVVALAGCSSPSDVVSENISKEAENFGIARRVIFINGITDSKFLVIEGRCNIEVDGDGGGQLEVTCRTPQGDKKHFLGLSDNVTYFVEQLNPSVVSQDHYKVYFNPSVIIPDVDAK